MKKLFQTLKNIWSIEELRSKILYTLMLILIYRIGTHIVLPGINAVDIQQSQKTNPGGILDLIDAFSGGAFTQASIFALGIMPYISASIFMQLMTVLVPQFQKMQKEGDSGRKKINQWTTLSYGSSYSRAGISLCCLLKTNTRRVLFFLVMQAIFGYQLLSSLQPVLYL